MTVKYKVVKMCQPGVTGGGTYKYYPRIYNRKRVKLREISEMISLKCTLHPADIMATLVALVDEIPTLLLDNKSVELGDLGIFSLNLKTIASSAANEVNASKIKDVKLAFRPSNHIKRKLREAKFSTKL